MPVTATAELSHATVAQRAGAQRIGEGAAIEQHELDVHRCVPRLARNVLIEAGRSGPETSTTRVGRWDDACEAILAGGATKLVPARRAQIARFHERAP